MLHPDAEIVDRDIPDADTYRGRDGYARWVAHWGESWSGWSLDGLDYSEAPDGRVLVLFDLRATGRGSGVELTRGDAMVCSVRDGKVTEIIYFNDQDRARAEAGME